MKLRTERDLSYIDPLTVEFFQNKGTNSISVILLINGRKDGRKDGQINSRKFSTSLAEIIRHIVPFTNYVNLNVQSN